MVKENAKAISAEADYVEQNGVPGIGVEAALNAAGIVEHENEELLRTLAATDHDAETRDLSDSEIDDALCRGETARAAWPLAIAAHYDPVSCRIVVDLANGSAVALHPSQVRGLGTASTQQLEAVEIFERGFGLRWEDLDVDVSVPGLVATLFRA
ncbi:DUF2442 domain-containing protein [Sulfitobacter sp. BDSS02]|uniref:DUF2442 domain-containing protein n=1 Tax=Heliomarina sp. TaxID=2917556 RepID=UPI00405917DA|nr:DUF2442 domain-containing protein [Sulfitobacter sp. BDSS02]MBR9852412.1 DUF2442 domain-containing protein [Paracoccaceae bacterium]